MPATFVIPSAFTAIDKFSGPVRNMGNALQGFVGRSERLLGRVNGAFDRLLTPLTSINKLLMGLGFYVGLFTLIRIIKNAIDIFANFEQANVDLAIVMDTTVQKNKILANDARRLGLFYGDGATNVVKMQHALATLGYEQSQILKMAGPIVTGSSALEGANPERLADLVGAVINAFDNLDAGNTQHILDVMSHGARRTSLTFEKLATTLPIVAGPANAVGISFERVVALLGVLSNQGVHVATSATSLKNIFIDSAKKGHTYEQVLENIAKNSNKLVYANKQFGKRSVVSALALSQHMNDAKDGVVALTEEFEKLDLGITNKMAVDRLNTFRGSQKLLSAAYQEFILGIEDGNGPLAESLTRITRVASAMLLLSTDSDQAREAIAKMSPDILRTANNWLGWLKVIGWVTAALIAMKVALMLWRGVVIAATIVQGAWSVALGLSATMGFTNIWALRGNAIAMGTLRVVTLAATIAQNAWNFALKVGPLYAIQAAIITVIAAMKLYDDALIESQKTKEEQLKNQFSQWDKPWYMQWGWADNAEEEKPWDQTELDTSMQAKARQRMRLDKHERINPKAYDESQLDSILNVIRSGSLNINLNDPGGAVKDMQSDSSWIKPKLSNTNGWSN